MNYIEALEYIHSLGKFGSRPGLSRIGKLLSLMGSPEKQLEFIHVAGTNGKGSTSYYIANVLKKAGKRTGLYTSPYITEFNERIRICDQNISNSDLAFYTEQVLQFAKQVFSDEDPITEFEFITALAFKYFADKKCDVVVLEVGLGGRLDATNVIEKSKASVIVKIDFDHTNVLGDTIEKIAAEKCGIIKQNCPVITTSQNEKAVLEVIKSFANKNSSKLYLNESDTAKIISSDVTGNTFLYNGNKYSTKMPGLHQIDNAVSAIKTLQTVYPDIKYETVFEGISTAACPARCELISTNPFILLDGSHNQNGTSALAKTLKLGDINNAVGIVGFMADKEVEQALDNVVDRFEKIYTVTVESNARSMTALALANTVIKLGVYAEPVNSYEEAIEKALLAKKPIVVFGSLYLAGDIRPLLISLKRQKST